MGGHIQVGEYEAFNDAIGEWLRYRAYFELELGLHLSYGEITYDTLDEKYKLAMRFVK